MNSDGATCRAVHEEDPYQRMVDVVKFYLSGFYKKPRGLKKPYNPILGERFRCYWLHPDGSKTFYVAEQVRYRLRILAKCTFACLGVASSTGLFFLCHKSSGRLQRCRNHFGQKQILRKFSISHSQWNSQTDIAGQRRNLHDHTAICLLQRTDSGDIDHGIRRTSESVHQLHVITLR